MGRVTAEGMDCCPDIEPFAVEVHVASSWPIVLNCPAGVTLGLVADEEDVVTRVAEHGLKVVDDAPAAAHATGGDDDSRTGGFGQVLHDLQVGLVVFDGQ